MPRTSHIEPRHDNVRVTAKELGRQRLNTVFHRRDRVRVDVVEAGVGTVETHRGATRRAAIELAAIGDVGGSSFEGG